nr:hypothetical protein BaRGS_009487 [Batillaria attramentaria]
MSRAENEARWKIRQEKRPLKRFRIVIQRIDFAFTVSYSGNVGFFIESINKQEGDTDWTGDHSWWHIYSLEEDGSGVARCEGVSTYIPSHEETVVFLLSDQFLNMSHCPEV